MCGWVWEVGEGAVNGPFLGLGQHCPAAGQVALKELHCLRGSCDLEGSGNLAPICITSYIHSLVDAQALTLNTHTPHVKYERMDSEKDSQRELQVLTSGVRGSQLIGDQAVPQLKERLPLSTIEGYQQF